MTLARSRLTVRREAGCLTANNARQRRRVVLLMVSLLASVTVVLLAGIFQNAPTGGPRLAGDLVVATGDSPGHPSTSRQRISYEASFTNTGKTPIHGWRWEVVIPPALQSRRIREEHRANPDPRSSPTPLDLNPGETIRITGYIDVRTEGTSKQQLEAIIEDIVVRITNANGQAILELPAR